MNACAHPVHRACAGNPHGPSLVHLLEVIGKEKTLGLQIESCHRIGPIVLPAYFAENL